MEIDKLIELAKSGDAVAQSKLGYHYLVGDGEENQAMLGCFAYVTNDIDIEIIEPLERNYEESFKWFNLAAEANNDPAACVALGKFYQFGCYVEKDYEKAIEYFRRAKKLGELSLVEVYFEIINREDAYDDYKESIKQESNFIITSLGMKIYKGTLEINAIDLYYVRDDDNYDYADCSEDDFLAFEILEFAAERGFVDAIYALARFIDDREHYDAEGAVELYKKGWALNDDRCGFMLAQYLEDGKGADVDFDAAIEIYETLMTREFLQEEAKDALKLCKKKQKKYMRHNKKN